MFFSFAKVSLLAALALPAAFAAPINADVSALDIVKAAPNLDVDSVTGGLVNIKRAEDETPAETVQSVPDVLSSLLEQLTLATGDLHSLVDGKRASEVNVGDVTLSLQNIQSILEGSISTVKTVISKDGFNVEVPLTLAGERITLIDLAQIVAAILNIVLEVLLVVFRLLGSLPVVSALLAFIGKLIDELLTVVFGIIPDLQAVVAAAVVSVVNVVRILDFVSVSKAISL